MLNPLDALTAHHDQQSVEVVFSDAAAGMQRVDVLMLTRGGDERVGFVLRDFVHGKQYKAVEADGAVVSCTVAPLSGAFPSNDCVVRDAQLGGVGKIASLAVAHWRQVSHTADDSHAVTVVVAARDATDASGVVSVTTVSATGAVFQSHWYNYNTEAIDQHVFDVPAQCSSL